MSSITGVVKFWRGENDDFKGNVLLLSVRESKEIAILDSEQVAVKRKEKIKISLCHLLMTVQKKLPYIFPDQRPSTNQGLRREK